MIGNNAKASRPFDSSIIALHEILPVRQPIPHQQRQFAVEVVRSLREHGFEACWAGGCVRDQLLSRTPYDYDVATSAQPPEIERVFHKRKTLAIGAAFGVITVVGPSGAGQIEVTTFRQDVAYTDGRHPDRIAFSSPEEDARRRDFTINGMFYDPLENRVIDFVGGQEDLRLGIVRAIGDARLRFTEDKLRMLRAIRFAAIFDFELEASTLAALREMAAQSSVVSAERIAAEMRIMLVHSSRVRAVELLQTTGLLQAIFPELLQQSAWNDGRRALAILRALDQPTFSLSLAALLDGADAAAELTDVIGSRWRLSRKEIDRLAWLTNHSRALAAARNSKWSDLQPVLRHEGAAELITLHAAKAKLGEFDPADAEFCRAQLGRPADELDPPMFLGGNDLIALGIPRGPVIAKLLRTIRAAQLNQTIANREAALELAERLWQEQSKPDAP
jgi:poly(A) polymerase